MYRWKENLLKDFDLSKALKLGALALAILAMVVIGLVDPSLLLDLPRGSVATVGNQTITRNEFVQAYRQTLQQMPPEVNEDIDKHRAEIRKVIDQLVQGRLYYMGTLDSGIRAGDKEIFLGIRRMEAFQDPDTGDFDPERLKSILRSNRWKEADLVERLRQDFSMQKFSQVMQQMSFTSLAEQKLDYRLQQTKREVEFLKLDASKLDLTISQADIQAYASDETKAEALQAYFDSHPEEYNSPAEVKARHILVSFKGARNATADVGERSKEQALQRAKTLRSQIDSSASFIEVAKKDTDEPNGKTSGGDLGWFSADKMVEAFSKAAFAMKPGEISTEPVETPFGYHLIYIEDKREEVKIPFEEAKLSIAEKLLRDDRTPQALDQMAQEVLDQLKQSGTDATATLTQRGLSWQTTGEFPVSSRYIPQLGADPTLSQQALALQTQGELSEQPIKVGNTRYILRLKSKTEADMNDFDPETSDMMARFTRFQTDRMRMESVMSLGAEQLESDIKVFRNYSEYEKFAQPQTH